MNIRLNRHGARRLALAAVVGASVVGSVVLASTVQGQEPQQEGSPAARLDPRQIIDAKMDRLTETLKLDSAQQVTVRSILSDETMEMEDLRKSSGGRGGGGGGEGRGGGGGRGRGRRGGGGGGGEGGGATADSAEGRGSGGPPKEMQAIRDRANRRIEAALRPDQLTTFRQMFEQGQRAGGDTTRRKT